MENLFEVPIEKRDLKWETQLISSFDKSLLSLVQDHPIVGPDNMPYLPVQWGEEGKKGEPAKQILEWVGSRGIGLVLNPDKNPPDFVFSYGMIWSFLTKGFFVPPEDKKPSQKDFSLKDGQQVYVGPLNDQVWPSGPRSIFANFLKDQGIDEGRALFFSTDQQNYDLCFSLESLGNPQEEEWSGILEAFSWFFPLDFSLSILSEKSFTTVQFDKI